MTASMKVSRKGERLPTNIELDAAADAFLKACRDLRLAYASVSAADPFTPARAREAVALHETITTLANDPNHNQRIVERRDRDCGPFSYEVRHGSVGVSNEDSAWKYETRVLDRYGVPGSELSKLRQQAQKLFADMRRRENSGSALAHPLISDMPLVDLGSRLNTEHIVSLGGSATLLSRRQRRSRKDRIEEDRQILAALMLLIANEAQQGERVFELSFSLAVAGYCLAGA
jgi:hypothetical protein